MHTADKHFGPDTTICAVYTATSDAHTKTGSSTCVRSVHHTEHLWFIQSSKYEIILIRLSCVPVATPRKASSHAEL